ncbi:MAG: HipA domain-containing protein [Treponema sp.]|nr:HipA domain-containing protein [Treponema sp.]
MKKILKHKDIDVALLETKNNGVIIRIIEILNKEHMPIPSVREDGQIDEDRLDTWWLGRGISENRKEYKAVMQKLNNIGKEMLLHLSQGLSLSDHYWMQKENENLKWKDINFYENEFDRSLGKLFFGIETQNKKYNFNSPDVTSSGNLKKRWDITKDGKRVLIKTGSNPFMQEPLNEVLATIICRKLGIPHVPYKIKYRKNEPYSECINLTNINRELIDVNDIYYIKEPTFENDNLYKHLTKCCEKLKVGAYHEMINRMLILDYLMLNHDRHYKNFGVTRNSETLDDYKFAPIYDTGSSFFHNDKNFRIKLPEYAKERTICFDADLLKQLKYITDFSWIKLNVFDDTLKECKETIYQHLKNDENNKDNEARAKLLCNVLEKRFEQIKIITEKKLKKN